jgi:hypothetical protein
MNAPNKGKTELSKIKKDNPFRVPDNYFDDFYARLQYRLQAETNTHPEKESKIIRFLKPALGLAASFALIFMLVYWPVKTFLPGNSADNTAIEIPDLEFFSIVDDIDENTFYNLLEDSDSSGEFSDEELVNYLSVNVSEYEIYLSTDY